MSCSKAIPLTLSIFCFSLFIQVAICSDNPYLFHHCFGQENYTASRPYRANLNDLLDTLSTKVPPTGFGFNSFGGGRNRVNGLALCRGDVSRSSCESCVIEASKELVERCPEYKGAIIWYDHCLLKYSNVDFFGDIDNQNKFYMINVQDVDNPTSFNRKIKELLSGLANKAYASRKLYATGELELGASEKLYGLAQCTRDLSGDDCKKCLDGAISELPSCCSGKRGGRVVGGSCNVRYELYPFLDA